MEAPGPSIRPWIVIPGAPPSSNVSPYTAHGGKGSQYGISVTSNYGMSGRTPARGVMGAQMQKVIADFQALQRANAGGRPFLATLR